jgi:hypothetical protein
MIKSRRKNEFSTSSPNHYVAHELGHVRNPSGRMANSWTAQLRKKGEMLADADSVLNAQRTARRVSRYAMTKPAEFAAETAAGRSLGKKYDNRVMRQFEQVTGRKPPSLRSQLNNQRPTTTTTRTAAAAVKPVRRASLRFTKQSSTRTTAELSGGNRINIAQQGPRSFRASLVGKSGSPKMERSGFRNISEAKKWAANPNARGPRLMGGGLNTEASAKATWRRAPRIASTIKMDRPRKRRS